MTLFYANIIDQIKTLGNNFNFILLYRALSHFSKIVDSPCKNNDIIQASFFMSEKISLIRCHH